MAKSPLILAALANDAVPNIHFIDVKQLSTNSIGAFDSALLTADNGDHVVIRVPNSAAAGAEQEVELRALSAIEAHRESLPFKFTKLLGSTVDQRGAKALVFNFVYGNPIDVPSLAHEGHLAESIGKAIAAIHNLPPSLVEDAHLPEYQPAQTVRARVADLDRAAATGRVPAVLLARWENALEDSELFHYQPTVIHGSLSGETVLELDDEVSAVLSWGGLRIGDPAEDFAWIFGAGVPELTDTVLMAYSLGRALSDSSIRQRATLYSELEMARWLLHGVSQNDQNIIDDAMAMLNGLAEELSAGTIRALTTSAIVAGAVESAFISAAEQSSPEELTVITEQITIVAEEPEVAALSDESDGFVDSGDSERSAVAEETEEPVSANDDTKTRVIELPEKGENELF